MVCASLKQCPFATEIGIWNSGLYTSQLKEKCDLLIRNIKNMSYLKHLRHEKSKMELIAILKSFN